VAVSPDDRFAFVTLELSDSMAVFDLRKALASGFGPADFVGTVPLGTAPVGLAMSPARFPPGAARCGWSPQRTARSCG
jgi:hypothetical protein